MPRNTKNHQSGTIETLAKLADKHECYEKAVQCVEAEIDIIDKAFYEIRGKRAKRLREDFCGTANTSCEWVRRRKTNHALGLDLDQEVLDWGKANNISKLSKDQQGRIEIVNRDVLEGDKTPSDIIIAMNFSYQLFKTRKSLGEYFSSVRKGLDTTGLFFIDIYGGYDSFKTVKEKTEYDEFIYYWHQKKYNPISGEMLCHIHFKFKDGSKMKKAFTYDWRLWTLPEIRELLADCGFSKTTVYWEGTDPETGEGNGEYNPSEMGDDDPSWIAYIVAYP